jgi:hypothetical protein
MKTSPTEAEKFDAVVRTLLSLSHEEIQKRDEARTAPSAVKGSRIQNAIRRTH